MNTLYNSQFMRIGFDLVDDPAFLAFINKAEFGTYVLLRRHIWRSRQPHALGLHELYWNEQKLATSLSAKFLAERLGLKDITRISKHLATLEDEGVIKRIRTGRQSIVLLGEWHDYSEGDDKSKRLEWFYLEQRFGVDNSDLAHTANSHAGDSANQTGGTEPSQNGGDQPKQTWPKPPNNNREAGRESNNPDTGSIKRTRRTKPDAGKRGRSPVSYLPDVDASAEEIEDTFAQIMQQMPDGKKMEHWYRLIARKVPAQEIHDALSHIKIYPGKHPGKIFSAKMTKYAINKLAKQGRDQDMEIQQQQFRQQLGTPENLRSQ